MTPLPSPLPDSLRPGALRLGAEDDDRVLRLYERGIVACAARSAQEVTEVVTRLVAMLDFAQEAPAMALFRLYDGCRLHAQARQFDTAARIFTQLGAAWTRAAIPAPTPARDGQP